MKIWEKCNGIAYIVALDEEPFRVIESQSTLTSRNLVDSNQEHDILEQMLENTKPRVCTKKHYLLFTPFRYPPLKHGSRFGRRNEKSLWYGSLDIETALAEVAYYRLLFLYHARANLGVINNAFTSFNAKLKTAMGINLCDQPFNQYETEISSKTDYSMSQRLGTAMRDSNIAAFIFRSARSKKAGKNIAIFTQDVFFKKKGAYTFNYETWHCAASKDSVMFCNQDRDSFSFPINDFSVDGSSVIAKTDEYVG